MKVASKRKGLPISHVNRIEALASEIQADNDKRLERQSELQQLIQAESEAIAQRLESLNRLQDVVLPSIQREVIIRSPKSKRILDMVRNDEPTSGNLFDGKKVAITGAFDSFSNRQKLINALLDVGATYQMSVNNQTDYLIVGTPSARNSDSESNKLATAKRLRIPTMSERILLSNLELDEPSANVRVDEPTPKRGRPMGSTKTVDADATVKGIPIPFNRRTMNYAIVEALIRLGVNRKHTFATFKSTVASIMSQWGIGGGDAKSKRDNKWYEFVHRQPKSETYLDADERLCQNCRTIQRMNGRNNSGALLVSVGKQTLRSNGITVDIFKTDNAKGKQPKSHAFRLNTDSNSPIDGFAVRMR